MPSTTIEFEHDDARLDPSGNDAEPHIDEIEVELTWEPGESNYGADADGNRGIHVPGYFYTDADAPTKCTECGHVYTEDELNEIRKKMNKAADDYEADDDPGYPED